MGLSMLTRAETGPGGGLTAATFVGVGVGDVLGLRAGLGRKCFDNRETWTVLLVTPHAVPGTRDSATRGVLVPAWLRVVRGNFICEVRVLAVHYS